MTYISVAYLFVFLPVVMLAYQFCPQKKRWIVLLAASWIFAFSLSRFLILWMFLTTGIAYGVGRYIGSMQQGDLSRKLFKKKKKQLMKLGVTGVLLILIVLKYSNFVLSTVVGLIDLFGAGISYHPLHLLTPIGISYYTLEAISYLVDVERGEIRPEKNLGRFAMYISFFPKLMEGPISRYQDVQKDMHEMKSITFDSLRKGYLRILWGLFMKLTIADHLAMPVRLIIRLHADDGFLCAVGAVACALQLYGDFAGTIEIAIGSAEIFGIDLPENFRQPFFAKNVTDFWRKWHITLGAFARTYIFYPIAFSKPVSNLSRRFKRSGHKIIAKYTGTILGLLGVWFVIGIWHGPTWTNVLYGLYYFTWSLLEVFLEKPFERWCVDHHLDVNGFGVRLFRFIKLFLIFSLGEFFFWSNDAAKGLYALSSIFTRFSLHGIGSKLSFLGMDTYDFVQVAVCVLVLFRVDVQKEKGVNLFEKYRAKSLPVRWTMVFVLIFAVIFFGAYGPGYTAEAMMYAGF